MIKFNAIKRPIGMGATFCYRLWLMVIGGLTMGIAANGQAKVNDITVLQYSRMDTDGRMLFANSTLAAIRFNAIPDAAETGYLNVVAKSPVGNDVWVIKNFPIFSQADNYSASYRQLELDLKNLNIRPGETVRSVKILAVVGPDIATRMPVGSFASVAVVPAVLNNETARGYDETTTYAGYTGVMAPADVNIHNADFPPIQEHTRGCTEGSFSRSIAWLNKKYNLGCTLTPQEIYNLLYSKTGPLGYDATVKEKAKLLDSIAKTAGKRGKTEFMDRGQWLGDIANIVADADVIIKDKVLVRDFDLQTDAVAKQTDELTPVSATPTTSPASGGDLGEVSVSDPIEWLKNNVDGNDIELNLNSSGVNHMITITGITCSGGTCSVTYRDDEHQNNPDKGDEAEKTAELKEDSIKFEGKWYKIAVLFKESITGGNNRLAVTEAPEAELLPNRPNPFRNTTILGVQVRKTFPHQLAELVIRDMNGTLIQRIKLKLQPGLNEVQFNTLRNEKGGLVCTLEIDGKPLQSRQLYVEREPKP
jgi:hypothetical protein